jgi:hypothetical protein
MNKLRACIASLVLALCISGVALVHATPAQAATSCDFRIYWSDSSTPSCLTRSEWLTAQTWNFSARGVLMIANSNNGHSLVGVARVQSKGVELNIMLRREAWVFKPGEATMSSITLYKQ